MSSRARAAPAARSAMGAHHGLRSETGHVRKANEDRMGFRRTVDGEVYVVCDGMGGAKGGAKAAQLAVQALIEQLDDRNGASDLRTRMQVAFAEANSTVFKHRRPDDPETRDMGSTAVAVLLRGTRLLIGHVGDSRAYRWSKAGGLRQLTRDHTRVQRLVEANVISPTEAANHPEASVLDRAMGHQPQVEADISDWVSLELGESVLLCSDGLSGYAKDSEISAVMNSEVDPQRQADKLTELALKKGGEDNVTVQVVQVTGEGPSMWARFFGAPLFILLIVTLSYLSMASWFHSEFVALHASNDALQNKVDALSKAAPPPIDQKGTQLFGALTESIAELKNRVEIVEQARSQKSPEAIAPMRSATVEKKTPQKKEPAGTTTAQGTQPNLVKGQSKAKDPTAASQTSTDNKVGHPTDAGSVAAKDDSTSASKPDPTRLPKSESNE